MACLPKPFSLWRGAPDGELWIGTEGGGLIRKFGKQDDPLWSSRGPSVTKSSVLSTWIPTASSGSVAEGGGINRYLNGHFSSLNNKNGMPQ